MKKRTKKTFSAVKIICVLIILILLSGVGVMAVTTQISSVSITLSDGYRMTVLTSKTNISEILEENNILLKNNERVTPDLDEDITESRKIVITDKSEKEIEIAKISESGIETTLDSLLEAYDTVTEKIEVKEEKIPYETIKKNVAKGAKSTKNMVVRPGKNGLKKVTYKVKYQNKIEIERNIISEKIIKKPVDKIVQVQEKTAVTSRGASMPRTTYSKDSDSSVKIYKITAYCSCAKCCGKSTGRTASGKRATAGRTVAAPAKFKFGTKLSINGKTYVVEDRGGAIKGNRIDIYVGSHSAALRWGVRYLPVKVE
ncbi:MAG: DUF348 domain-containing protein [Clostridia bacterium]|nr:DUF348 domain-containing protein [Clostridia bacterium]